jgi:hypothetical protein
MSNQAQAIALTCIDFRFRRALQEFFENELNLYAVDHKADDGGVKMLLNEGPVRDWIFANFEIAFNKHNINRVILVNHQDCEAYGGSESFDGTDDEINKQEVQLRHGVSVVQSKYPDKQVEAYLALFDDKGKVSFKKIV